MILTFDDNTTYEIGLYKFKKFARNKAKNTLLTQTEWLYSTLSAMKVINL